MRRRPLLLGVLVAAIYVVGLLATNTLRHDDTRPLYDGFALPSSYQFVDPPPFFKADNVKPKDATATIALMPSGSTSAGVATPDGQFIISLGRNAIAPAPGATSVSVHITALAPSTLPAAPDQLRANGNAYRIDMTYQPTRTAVPRFTHPGTMLLALPELGDALFTSTDATQWSRLRAHTVSPQKLSLSATFAAPGYYMAATSLPELAAQPGRSQHTAVVLGIAVALVALVLFGVASWVVRRRAKKDAGPAPVPPPR